MKSSILSAVFSLIVLFASAQDRISMGEIKFKDTVSVKWLYENKTDKAVVVLASKTDCDCVTVEYPKSPIKPLQSEMVLLKVYAKELGNFVKNIDLTISNGEKKRIIIIGKVVNR